jgi:hypothetical protein
MSLFGIRRHAPFPAEGHLPGYDGATGWLNSPPLTVDVLRGKVVLVDFWTYAVWRAFSNQYWPAIYIADAEDESVTTNLAGADTTTANGHPAVAARGRSRASR